MEVISHPDSTLQPIRGLPHGARVLVVEDRDYCPARNLLRGSLQSLGLEVFLAPDTRRAGRILEQVPIELLILYALRPENEPWLDWVQSVAEQRPEIALIVVADRSADQFEQRCDALGAAAYLAVPITLRTLRRCIERAFACRAHLQEIHRLRRELEFARAEASGPVRGREFEHVVDDLWFAILGQALRGRASHS